MFWGRDDGFVRLQLEGVDIGLAMGVPECKGRQIGIFCIFSRGILYEALLLVILQHVISALQLLL